MLRSLYAIALWLLVLAGSAWSQQVTSPGCPLAGCTFSGPLSATTLSLSDPTTPLILNSAASGLAAPTFTSRSAGSRYVVYPNVGPSAADYAIGIASGALWMGVGTTANAFNWYAGTTLVGALSGAGNFTNTGSSSSGGGAFTLSSGEVGMTKITASGSAPGAGTMKFDAVAGTNAGTCKLIAYAGTSSTPVTVVDNVGAGC